MKKYIRLKWLLAILILSALTTGYYIWNQPARDIQNEAATIRIGADSLFNAFNTNEQAANQRFLDKAIVVTGKVGSISTNSDGKKVVFIETSDPMFGVNCTMEDASVNILKGDQVAIKGICTGYTSDVIIIRSYLLKMPL